MKIHFLGHSAILIETNGQRVVIDPFISGNPVCSLALADVKADFIILSHAHGDHWGDTLALATGEGQATVIATAEIAGYAQKHGAKAHAMNIGGKARFAFGSVKLTMAWHSSSFPDGTYGGMPCGLLLNIEGKTIYHAGDTALFDDMRTIGDHGIDLAMLPIGDNFTMGPDDALQALHLLRAKAVMPMHYNTFAVIHQDGLGFGSRAEAQGVRAFVPKPGESFAF
jgi:L-ascorbate metabolism protein UlaG (beta-lactamase superfamily)